jgi:protein-S-isoprenylcysteine O-methyltransferase Ste14
MVCNDISITRLVIYVVLLIDLLFKIQYEEQLLTKHFSEYANYQKQTAKLIPFIY